MSIFKENIQDWDKDPKDEGKDIFEEWLNSPEADAARAEYFRRKGDGESTEGYWENVFKNRKK